MLRVGLHGDFDGGAFDLVRQISNGAMLETVAIGSNANDNSSMVVNSGEHTKLFRLNNGYLPSGTIPLQSEYNGFAQRCANWVSGLNVKNPIVLIGNEMNHINEIPHGHAITAAQYIECYNLCYSKIKNANPNALISIGAVAPYNDSQGDWVLYQKKILESVRCDILAVHTYSRGYTIESCRVRNKMGAPYQNRDFGFGAFEDFLREGVPTHLQNVPVWITEMNGDVKDGRYWDSMEAGYMSEIVNQISQWNQSNYQKVHGVIFYRWDGDSWRMRDKPHVHTEFLNAARVAQNVRVVNQVTPAPSIPSIKPVQNTQPTVSINTPSKLSYYEVCNTETVNLRAYPFKTEDNILGELKRGAVVTIDEEKSASKNAAGWKYITISGYVSEQFLATTQKPESDKQKTQSLPSPSLRTVDSIQYNTIRVLMKDGVTVKTMPVEEYLRFVLPAEMPPSYDMEALKAQAIAARTYALFYVKSPKFNEKGADISADHRYSQEMGETVYERTDQAIKETAGQVLIFNNALINAMFSHDCGGITKSFDQVFGDYHVPYLTSVGCYNTGQPHGHGVGLCQEGAHYFAKNGWTYHQILLHYYQSTELVFAKLDNTKNITQNVTQQNSKLLAVPYVSQLLGTAVKYHNDCGAASAAMLIAYHTGKSISVTSLYESAQTTDSYLSIAQVQTMLRQNGVETQYLRNLTIQNVKNFINSNVPLLVLFHYGTFAQFVNTENKSFKGGHFAVLVGYDEKFFFIHDPLWSSLSGANIAILHTHWIKSWEDSAIDQNPICSAIIKIV